MLPAILVFSTFAQSIVAMVETIIIIYANHRSEMSKEARGEPNCLAKVLDWSLSKRIGDADGDGDNITTKSSDKAEPTMTESKGDVNGKNENANETRDGNGKGWNSRQARTVFLVDRAFLYMNALVTFGILLSCSIEVYRAR